MKKIKIYLLVLLFFFSLIPLFSSSVNAYTTPIVTTNAATNITVNSATLNGVLTDDSGSACNVSFQYGLTKSYGTNTTNQSKTTSTWDNQTVGDAANIMYGSIPRYAKGYWSFSGSPTFVYFYLYKTNTPSGVINATVRYQGNDSLICQSVNAVNASNLTESGVWYQFNFINSPYLFNQDIYVCCEFYGGDESNVVYVVNNNIANNMYYYGGGTWYNLSNTNDIRLKFQYNSSIFSYNVSPLNPGTLYHYRAFATNTNGTSYGSDMSFLTKINEPTNLNAVSSNAYSIDLTWSKGSGANNTIILRKTTGYPTTYTDGTLIYNNTGTSYTNTGLSSGILYYYRAWSYTNWDTFTQYSDTYTSDLELTKPEAPTNPNISFSNSTTINLSWIKGTGANNTVIVMKNTGIPNSITDGTIVYNNTGTYSIQNITSGIAYSFSAWSYTTWNSLNQYSTNYTNFTTNMYINVFNESSPWLNVTNYGIQVTDISGNTVYTAINCNNTLQINTSQCPTGNVTILISSTNYTSRIYSTIINSNSFLFLNAYLPPTDAPADNGQKDMYTNHTYPYTFTINNCAFNVIISNGVLVTVKRYMNNTGKYETVGSMITDAVGQCSIGLRNNVLYKIVLTKTGYIDSYNDYVSDYNYPSKTFCISYSTNSITNISCFICTISLNVTMYNDSFILMNYADSGSTTVDTQVNVYDLDNLEALVYTNTRNGISVFTENITGINTSRSYLVQLYYNNSKTFDITSPLDIPVYNLVVFTPGFSKPDFNDRINKVFGPPSGTGWDLGGWGNVVVVSLALIVLCTLGPFNAGMGVIGTGITITGLEAIWGILFINTFNAVLTSLGPLAIILGVVMMMTKGDGDNT